MNVANSPEPMKAAFCVATISAALVLGAGVVTAWAQLAFDALGSWLSFAFPT
jgi:hypothetical protein